jgi:hypothetical protein
MEGREGQEVQLLLIHDLGTRWGEWSMSSPAALSPGKRAPGTTAQETGWAPGGGLDTEVIGKISSAADRTSIARSSSPWPDTILSYPGSLTTNI